MRLDIFLVARGLTKSRTEAKQLIVGGFVSVLGKTVTQPAHSVEEDMPIDACEIDRSQIRYVSRGGLKLEGALKTFSLSPENRICLDVGASSGGFTDCLLQNGAAYVYAVDAGEGQMSAALIGNPRIVLVENYNARYMKKLDFDTISDEEHSEIYYRLEYGGHRIGGYPCFEQCDPRDAEPALRVYDTLLLQIVSHTFTDDNGKDTDLIMFGDEGSCQFFIPREKLRQRDFSDVMFWWDCN